MDLRFIRYEVKLFTNEKLQNLLDNKKLREQNFEAWCVLLEEKLFRNEIYDGK